MFLNGDEISEPGPRGERIVDDSFLVLINGPEPLGFRLPDGKWASTFELVLDTAIGYAQPDSGLEGVTLMADDELAMAARSLMVLRKTG
jgi:glycogen operon protein